jgi:hypothetical protein
MDSREPKSSEQWVRELSLNDLVCSLSGYVDNVHVKALALTQTESVHSGLNHCCLLAKWLDE